MVLLRGYAELLRVSKCVANCRITVLQACFPKKPEHASPCDTLSGFAVRYPPNNDNAQFKLLLRKASSPQDHMCMHAQLQPCSASPSFKSLL